MTTTQTAPRPTTTTRTAPRSTLYNVLVGLVTLDVLLQGLWAGIFLEHDGRRDAASSWIDVHARGADVAIVLTAAAAVVVFWKLRSRKDLLLGTLGLLVLLVLEAYLGGLVRDDGQDTLTAVHVPLAMAIMALAVWLPLRSRHAARDRA